jgi:RecJ-like exonuclease
MDVLKIAISVAILVILAVFFITQYDSETTARIKDLKVGEIEKITGMITSVYTTKDRHVFLKVADSTGEITVVAFNNSDIDVLYELESNDHVSVLGKVDAYKGKLEIIAKEIKKA